MLMRLREAARTCSNAQYKLALQMFADELSGRINVLYSDCTEANMIALNGTWANAARCLKDLSPEGTPDPTSGDVEAPVFERKVA